QVEALAIAVNVQINNMTIAYPDGHNASVRVPVNVTGVDVSVVKTSDDDTYYVGGTAIWTIKVSNAANGTDATEVVLYDVLPSEFEFIDYEATTGYYDADEGVWYIGFMGNGTSETLTITSLALIEADDVTNVAEVTSHEKDWDLTNNIDNETVDILTTTTIRYADLAIVKLVSNPNSHYGEVINWTVTVTNLGPNTAENVIVNEVIPAGLRVLNVFGGEIVDNVWHIGNLEKLQSATLIIETEVEVSNATIVNVVNTTSDTEDPDDSNNHASNRTVVPPEADLEIIKLVSNKAPHKGDIITWTIKVINHGRDAAVNTVVYDKLPYGLVYRSDDSNGAYNHVTGIWNVGTLARGESAVLKIKTLVDTTNATIINIANVSSDTPDPNMTNNKCNNSTTVPPEADLVLTKDVNTQRVVVGDKVTFTIVVNNLGPDVAVNTRAYDVLPEGLKLISFKASRGTYDPETGVWTIGDLKMGERASLTIVAEALITGVIVNEAYVESDTYDPNMTNNYDNATVIVEEPSQPPVPPLLKHPTGNPIVMVVLSLLSVLGVTLRRKL
uniref:DUF11 domain-containing protein n=1 Tax=Methanobrevibacter sp. TaxID=66852 RepID=UPI003864E4F6